jgi:hypothetical protein
MPLHMNAILNGESSNKDRIDPRQALTRRKWLHTSPQGLLPRLKKMGF